MADERLDIITEATALCDRDITYPPGVRDIIARLSVALDDARQQKEQRFAALEAVADAAGRYCDLRDGAGRCMEWRNELRAALEQLKQAVIRS